MQRLSAVDETLPSRIAFSAAKSSSSSVNERSSMKINGFLLTVSTMAGISWSCFFLSSISLRPLQAYSFAIALTVEDLPVPQSP